MTVKLHKYSLKDLDYLCLAIEGLYDITFNKDNYDSNLCAVKFSNYEIPKRISEHYLNVPIQVRFINKDIVTHMALIPDLVDVTRNRNTSIYSTALTHTVSKSHISIMTLERYYNGEIDNIRFLGRNGILLPSDPNLYIKELTTYCGYFCVFDVNPYTLTDPTYKSNKCEYKRVWAKYHLGDTISVL